MIPLALTTIRVLRIPPDPERDPLEEQPVGVVVARGVRATISAGRGFETLSGGGSQEVIYFRLSCDPVDLLHTDNIVDETTDEVYEVQQVLQRYGLGLDHTNAQLKQITGVMSRAIRTWR